MHAFVLSCFSHVQLSATLWTVAHCIPLSMGFSRQESWSGLPFPSPEDLPDSGIEPGSPALQADDLLTELLGKLAVLSKESACNAEDLGSIPESGRSSGEGNGNPLQHTCLENPMDRSIWWAPVLLLLLLSHFSRV